MAKHRTQEKNLYFTLAIFVKYPKKLDHAPLCPVKERDQYGLRTAASKF